MNHELLIVVIHPDDHVFTYEIFLITDTSHTKVVIDDPSNTIDSLCRNSKLRLMYS